MIAAQFMRAADEAVQQPRHRGLGAFCESEVEDASARDRALFDATDATPSLAHIAAAIPQAGACADAAGFLEDEIVAPSVNTDPPVERRISSLGRRPAPESLVERIFEGLDAVRTEQVGSQMSSIDQLDANTQVRAAGGSNRRILLGADLRRKLRDRNWNAGHRTLALGDIIEGVGNKLLPPAYDREVLRAHDVVLADGRPRNRGGPAETSHLIAVSHPPSRAPHAQRLPIDHRHASARDQHVSA